jgi:hypothetical protein
MTSGILRESNINFASPVSAIGKKPPRKVLQIGTSKFSRNFNESTQPISTFHDSLPENAHEVFVDDNLLEDDYGSAESFLCHICDIQQPSWTIEEVGLVKSHILTLSPIFYKSDWIPSQLNIDVLLNKVIENIKNYESVNPMLYEILHLLLAYNGHFNETSVLNAFGVILGISPFRGVELDLLRSILSKNFTYEAQLLDLFWETSGEILKNTERLTLRNSIALSFSRVLSIFCQVFFEKEPDSILQFMTKLADRVMDSIVNKIQPEMISFLIDNFFFCGKSLENLYIGYFFQRLIKLLLAAVLGKFDIASRTIILDKLLVIYSLACPEMIDFSLNQFMAEYEPTIELRSQYFYLLSCVVTTPTDQEAKTEAESKSLWEFKEFFVCHVIGSFLPKLPGILLKILFEDSAGLRQKSLKFLYLLYRCRLCSTFTKEFLDTILSQCLHDQSVWVKDVAIDILIEELENGHSISSQSIDAILNCCVNLLKVILYFIVLLGFSFWVEK